MNEPVVIGNATLYLGDCLETLKTLPSESVNCCVTSPPYFGLRSYCADGSPEKEHEIGTEQTPAEYVARLVDVFAEVRRVLREDGTCWINLGDSYANDGKWGGSSGGKHVSALHGSTGIGRNKQSTGLKPKDLIGIPWRVAFALQADGWWLRQDIIWAKKAPMPESVKDRCTKAHEYLFLLTKSARYWWDAEAMKEESAGRTDMGRMNRIGRVNEGGEWASKPPDQKTDRNRRTVWNIATKPYSGAHFAVMPPKLVEPCILAGCPKGGVVLDPFSGSGTVGEVAVTHGRRYIGCELNPEYIPLNVERLSADQRQQTLQLEPVA